METNVSELQLARVGEFIAGAMGLYFPPARWADLLRGLAAAAAELGFADAAACAQGLPAAKLTRRQLDILAHHLTVGETYFFRESRSFEILTNDILPPLIRARRAVGNQRLRIWSAACCTGEEAYSIAIALRQILPDWPDWQVTILATDINARALRKASAGLYTPWSFRNAPEGFQARYFQPAAQGRFMIAPEIKRLVKFTYLNLMDEAYLASGHVIEEVDIIFCRNVLMYFSPAHARQVIQNLYRAQAKGGWLVVSPSETPHITLPSYAAVRFPDAVMYRKAGGEPVRHASLAKAPNLTVVGLDTKVIEQASLLTDAQAAASISLSTTWTPPEAAQSAPLPATAAADSVPFNLRARSLANEGRLAEALAQCDAWIAQEKLNPAAYYLRASVLLEQGAQEAATDALRRTLYLEPDFVLAHFALGNLARSAGRAPEAEKNLKNARQALAKFRPDEIVPASDGLTAGRLREIIDQMLHLEATG